MNKNKTIIAIIVAVVAVLAIAGIIYAMSMNNSKTSDSVNGTSETSSNVDPAKEFNPEPLSTLAYVSTTSTTVAGQTVESTTESDGKGTTKTSSSFGGTTTESYVTGTTVITCVNGECTKTQAEAASEEMTATAQDASQYKSTATHTGEEACGSETCQVWKATGPAGEVMYYVNGENRIAKISMSGTGATTTYEYKSVSITVPTV